MPSSTDTRGAATRALTIFSLAATLLSTPLSEARAERGLGIAEAAGVMGPKPSDRSAAPASRPDSASVSGESAVRIVPLAGRGGEKWGELVGWGKNLRETNEDAMMDGKPVVVFFEPDILDCPKCGIFKMNVLYCSRFNAFAGRAHFVHAVLSENVYNRVLAETFGVTQWPGMVVYTIDMAGHVGTLAQMNGLTQENLVIAALSRALGPAIEYNAARAHQTYGACLPEAVIPAVLRALEEQFAKYRVAIPELNAMEKKFDEFERAMR
ncbi:hypothetical protein [Methylosinus sp. PW1]|uniref:hypothetical protein n=1 Tax=Methylosinus sp. PW1 TaxID=107636 RepID=UPI00055EC868|nr:hypothetical protein [Methylosinus sp. PW1]